MASQGRKETLVRRFNPTASPQARDAVKAIIRCLDESGVCGRSLERFSLLQDRPDGQRAPSRQTIEDYAGAGSVQNTRKFAAGLDAYFTILCHLVSAAALMPDRTAFLHDMRRGPSSVFSRRIADILSGRLHAAHGVNAFLGTSDSQWFGDEAAGRLELPLKEILLALADAIETGRFDVTDPMQRLHRAVFPADLSHATGQFYTPPWLAEFVLKSTGWRPGERLIDPFCGSGVFLLAALQASLAQGHAIEDIAPILVGIDISAVAACAARTNLVLACARHDRKKLSGLAINILCADALAPAIALGRQLAGEPASEDPPDSGGPGESHAGMRSIGSYGWDLARWGVQAIEIGSGASLQERARAERSAVLHIDRANVIVTNPPWVGWEYIPRGYRDMLTPAWKVYGLFEQRGIKAAFLKEDLSTLCVPAALDLYLRDQGRAGLVLRQSTMKSDLAGRGVRRLSIFKDRDPLELTHIHDLGNLNVFDGAVAPAAVWLLNKGAKTRFPVPVSCWSAKSKRSVAIASALDEVLGQTRIAAEFCRPLSAADPEGRWSFDVDVEVDPIDAIKGSNALKPRIGFFTGGANAVYYLERAETRAGRGSRYRNIVERAKRQAPQVTVELEPDLIYPVVRGRDVSFWNVKSEVFVLNPHTSETKIRPIPEQVMRSDYPKCFGYLQSMRRLLDQRRGFSGWEKKTQEEYFYAIQRIGDYSFSPYKVCWSYISEDFVVGVCGYGQDGRLLLPNDKVVFLPAATREEAFFLAGILSFNVIRASVISSVSGRQVSGNVIRHYAVPAFDLGDTRHGRIASLCADGHRAIAEQDLAGARALYEALNLACADLFGLPDRVVETAARRLEGKLGYYPFRPVRRL